MATKKYVSLSKLSTFLDNLKDIFALSSHNHKISDITDYTIDSSLSSTSTNPVQNKVLDAEFEAISAAMNALEQSIDSKADIDDLSAYETKEDAQVKYDEITDAKADWNQNDEAAIDYVKNRTHWVEQSYEVILEEITAQSSESLIDYIDSNIYIYPDEVFIITVDGVQYRCISWSEVDGVSYIGDSRFYDLMADAHPEDVPFLIFFEEYWPDDVGADPERYCDIYLSDDKPHTLKIERESDKMTYHPLDEQYIPDTIARKEYVDTNFALKSEIDNIDLSA